MYLLSLRISTMRKKCIIKTFVLIYSNNFQKLLESHRYDPEQIAVSATASNAVEMLLNIDLI